MPISCKKSLKVIMIDDISIEHIGGSSVSEEFNSEVESILLGSGDYSVFKDLVDKEFFDWYFKKQVQAKKKLSKTKIKIRTLNSILIESKAPRLIDFFSLDVEGMEMKVLGGIDFDNPIIS